MEQFVRPQSHFSKSPVALIIGCGDMGMATARALGRRRPLLIVDLDAGRLEAAVTALQREGYLVVGQPCDITDRTALESLTNRLASGSGVGVLAHVAAVGNAPGGWRTVMQVDLIGVHLTLRAVGPHIVRGGVAILISSTGAYLCPRDGALEALLDDPLQVDFLAQLQARLGYEPDFLQAYFMAKQGLNRLAQRLAIEWGPREVRVLSVSPGLIDSTMGRTGGKLLPVYDGQGGECRLGTRAEKAKKEVPLIRQGSLLEVAAVIEFLASDAASFVNGIDVPVDGGSTAKWRAVGAIHR